MGCHLTIRGAQHLWIEQFWLCIRNADWKFRHLWLCRHLKWKDRCECQSRTGDVLKIRLFLPRRSPKQVLAAARLCWWHTWLPMDRLSLTTLRFLYWSCKVTKLWSTEKIFLLRYQKWMLPQNRPDGSLCSGWRLDACFDLWDCEGFAPTA